jgi:hypothetical protein
MTSSVDSAATAADMAAANSDDNSTTAKNKSGKPLKAGYNNGLKKRGGHSTKQDPNKVDTSGERVIEPRQVVSVSVAFCARVLYFYCVCGRVVLKVTPTTTLVPERGHGF